MKITRRLFAVAMVVTLMCPTLDPAAAAEPIYPRGHSGRPGADRAVLRRHRRSSVSRAPIKASRCWWRSLPAAAYERGHEAAFKANPAGAGGVKPREHRDLRRPGLLHDRNRQGWRRHGAALFDDPAGRRLLRLCRRAGPGERHQDLHRRRRAADVRHRRRSARKFRSKSNWR